MSEDVSNQEIICKVPMTRALWLSINSLFSRAKLEGTICRSACPPKLGNYFWALFLDLFFGGVGMSA